MGGKMSKRQFTEDLDEVKVLVQVQQQTRSDAELLVSKLSEEIEELTKNASVDSSGNSQNSNVSHITSRLDNLQQEYERSSDKNQQLLEDLSTVNAHLGDVKEIINGLKSTRASTLAEMKLVQFKIDKLPK